jgi:hypothetical protein
MLPQDLFCAVRRGNPFLTAQRILLKNVPHRMLTRSIYKQLNRAEDQFCYAVAYNRHVGARNVRFPKTAEPTVLLIDRNPLKQQLRATVLRTCEIDVRTTDNLAEAQRLCRIQRYDMILLAADGDSDAALISSELWKVSPRQRISLFVGPPKYLKEIGARQSQSASPPNRFARRLHLVDPQPQATQWRAFLDRLLAAG